MMEKLDPMDISITTVILLVVLLFSSGLAYNLGATSLVWGLLLGSAITAYVVGAGLAVMTYRKRGEQ